MSFKTQLNSKYWNDSKQIFFTPKLSLEGRNLFPQISEVHAFHVMKDQPFLNILKKPIMSLYDRAQARSEKKPVCIVGMPKEVEIRHVRTGNMKKTRREANEASFKKETLTTFSPHLTKTETEVGSCPSKQVMPISHPSSDGAHYYVLGGGNNRDVVEEVLRKREGWHPTASSIFHLKWEQSRPKFHNLAAAHKQAINHLPGHEVLSDKGNLLTQLKRHCEKNEELMYKIVPASFVLDFSTEDVEEELKKFISFFLDCSGKRQANPEKEDEQDMRASKLTVKRKGNDLATTLDSPKKSIAKGAKYSPVKPSKYRNEVLQNPENRRKEEIKILYKLLIGQLKPFYAFQDMAAPKRESPWVTMEPEDIYGESSLWLLKPSDLNRGRGIKLFRTVEELGQLLKGELQKHEGGNYVVQKYIERPLLIKGRKFDIRVWALVTHNRELFFFQEGYIRLTSEQFQLESSSLLNHLTNNAVQKHGTNYGEFEEGNILPLSYLYEKGHLEKNWLFGQIKRKIVQTMKAAGNRLYRPTDKHQSISVGNISGVKQKETKMKYFQVFGYDFMVDSRDQLWLIEVNTNPCLELSNQWLSAIIPRMLDDGFKLTIDKLFGRKNGKDASDYPVEGYSDCCNMWEPLDLSEEGSCLSTSMP